MQKLRKRRSGPWRLAIQSILYNNDLEAFQSSLLSLSRSAELLLKSGMCNSVSLFLGDSSPTPLLDEATLGKIRQANPSFSTVGYLPFEYNAGTAAGHNKLAAMHEDDLLLIRNPDVFPAPRALEQMVRELEDLSIGIVEAKQLPIEHPKDYDPKSGDTSWAATAFAMFPRDIFDQVGGFDQANFFLYCDDVDFSWRVRELGLRVVFLPSAVVFHDKRLGEEGEWQPSSAEKYYSAEASLFLTTKWGRPDLAAGYLKYFEESDEDHLKRAAKEYRRREEAGLLPAVRRGATDVAQFVGYQYAKHRFEL